MPRKPTAKSKKPTTTKLDQIVNHLRRMNGASLAELVKTTRWQPYSVRGCMSGTLKKRGLIVVSAKQDGKDRRYRLMEAA